MKSSRLSLASNYSGGEMFSLSDLKSGLCQGKRHVAMACGLTEFPEALFSLADSLEILDLSNNQLDSLPDDFARLHKLRILFLSENNFQVFPKVLAKCPNLSMVGFKSNQIVDVPEDSLPKNIRWLILTDNRITAIPESIGKHTKLQKLMLAGNQIKYLPESMVNCKQLELFRISANQLKDLPTWLFTLPKLAWLAFAGNPCLNHQETQPIEIAQVGWDQLEIKQVLGEGASGTIFQAAWKDNIDIAVKVFKAHVTSDGYPADEQLASTIAGEHPHLIKVLGQFNSHPTHKKGLLLSYIPKTYQNLGNPPSLETCTRDTYLKDASFSTKGIISIMTAIASVAAHLHQKNINHGDLYAHNILINTQQHCYLGDFGAATVYTHIDSTLKQAIEALEVRAFGCLLEDLLLRNHDKQTMTLLSQLKEDCLQTNTTRRPNFTNIHQTLMSIQRTL